MLIERWRFRLAALSIGAMTLFAASPAPAEDRVVVEVDEQAELVVDRRFVRRLVQLELRDVDVPPPHNAATVDPVGGLYVRIVRADESLIVQLWDRGELQGQRHLSVRGGPQLRARRVALVSAELARGLAARRALLAAKARRTLLRSQHRAMQRAEQRREEQPTLGSELRLAMLGWNDGWMWGSGLRGRFALQRPLQVSLSLTALTGYSSPLRSSFQWLEVGLRPAYVWRLSRQASVSAGPDIAAAVVRVVQSAAVDDIEGRSETWSARVGVFAQWRYRLSSAVSFTAGPEIGIQLRPIEAAPVLGDSRRLSPLWLGLSAGISVSGR